MVIGYVRFGTGAIAFLFFETNKHFAIENDPKIVLHAFIRYKGPNILIYDLRNLGLYDYTL